MTCQMTGIATQLEEGLDANTLNRVWFLFVHNTTTKIVFIPFLDPESCQHSDSKKFKG